MSWLCFTGAGISKDSGIPTFEELGDLRQKLSRSYFRQDPEDFYRVLRQIEETTARATPNAAHIAIAEAGLQVVTMNIDGLHSKAGSQNVLEIHGSMETVFCPKCHVEYPFETVYEDIRSSCCEGVLEPRVVLYEDALKDLQLGYDMLLESDGLLIVGTSFYTSTATYFQEFAKQLRIPIHTINADAAGEVGKFIKNIVKSEK
jgi:NAD-dependent deacetylase